VLLDYQMPDANGIDILTELRKDTWGSQAAVIVMTNVYELEIVNQMMALGVHDYVLKSDIQLDETVNLVGNYVPATAE
jgi:DNA-binding NarL/FixJ family response regulator